MKILPKHTSTCIVYQYHSKTTQMYYEMENNFWIQDKYMHDTAGWDNYDSYVLFNHEQANIWLLFNKKDIMYV